MSPQFNMIIQNGSGNILSIKTRLVIFFNLLGSHKHEILLFFVLCLALLLRLYAFYGAHYTYQPDYNRDYLVAHHILTYHELPLAGPDGEFGGASNSPAYFYLLTLPLLIKDSIIFLGMFNVSLQMITLILVYIIARSLFGKHVGLIALILWGLSQSIIDQSNYVWQPHIMQPFLLFSFLLLYRAYARKNYGLLLSSICVFLFAAVVHQSVYGLIPAYLFAIFLVLRAHQKALLHYAGVIATFGAMIIVLHLPLFLFFTRHHNSAFPFSNVLRAFLTISPPQLLDNLSSRTKIFLNFFLGNDGLLSPFIFPLGILFITTAITYLLYGRRDREHKNVTLILFFAFLQFFAVAIMMSISPLIPYPFWYFTPLFGIFIICLAEIIYGLTPQKSFSWIIHVSAVIVFLVIFSPNLVGHTRKAVSIFISDPSVFLAPDYKPPLYIATIKKEILAIQKDTYKQNVHFFDVRTFRFGREDPYLNEVIWVPLESQFGIPLVILDDQKLRSYRPIGEPEYIVLSCSYTTDDVSSKCITPFLSQFPQYHIEKSINDSPKIYLARKLVS